MIQTSQHISINEPKYRQFIYNSYNDTECVVTCLLLNHFPHTLVLPNTGSHNKVICNALVNNSMKVQQ